MPVTPTQVLLVVALAVAFGFVWYAAGRRRWRSTLERRLLYGVPWGTLVTVAVVVAFYLFAQGGFRNWDEPVVYAFVTWSYLYPTGLVTAGISHGSPAHLVSNLTTTLVMAPIAEYAFSHYPPSRRDGLASRPWVRALVVFPGALLGAAFLTAVFSLGPGLGFSGAVFAIVGFAVVNYPMATVVAVVASSALGTFYEALTQPVVRETIEVGAPLPPDWAGIGFQAHLLGFLLGALVAVALLRRRGRNPPLDRVFFGTILVGLVQALWLLVWSVDDVFFLYQGAGVLMVIALAVLVAVAAAGDARALPRPLSILPRAPTRRQLAIVWLLVVLAGGTLGIVAVLLEGGAVGVLVGALVFLTALAALPALPPLVPDRWFSGPVTQRGTAVAILVVFTVLVAVPSVPLGLVTVDGATLDSGVGVEVGDYTAAYVQNETPDRTQLADFGANETDGGELSGVVLISDDREMWTVGEQSEMVEHTGNATVTVGGLGWRETLEFERTGWEVLGNDTAYAVDVEVDGERTRTFTSDPVRANAQVDGHDVAVVPVEDGFELRVTRDGAAVGETTVSESADGASVGDLEFEVRDVGDTEGIFVSADDTTVQIATLEEY